MSVLTSPPAARPRRPKASVLHALAAGLAFDRYFRYRRSRDGDPFLVRFPGFGDVLFTGHPDGARDVFRTHPLLLEPPHPNPIGPLVGPASIILAAGERHRRERSLLMPPFHGDRMHTYGAAVRDITDEAVARWRPGQTLDARDAARDVALRVILRVVLGEDPALGRGAGQTVPAVREFMDSYGGTLLLVPAIRRSLLGCSPWDRFEAARDRLDVVLAAAVRRRRAQLAAADDAGDDILGMLLRARYEDGGAPADADLVDQLRTLIIAGHETTATSVVWVLFRLHRAPELLARVRSEIRALGPDPDAGQLAALPLLDAVCHETLRLHPPVPIVLRRVVADAGPEDVIVHGVPVPPGGTIGVSVPLLHSDPTVWSQPERFDPERWTDARYNGFEYAPFGGGHRRCVGFALARYEMRIVVATILGRAELALHPSDLRRRPPMSVPRNIATSPARPITFTVRALNRG